jgi:two-component system, NarL family, response regulator LiaR
MVFFRDADSAYRIRVLIADDQATVRSALKFFILACDDLELVGESIDGEQAIQLCMQAQPDVVLMDLLMPRMNGVSATRLIRQCCPRVQIVALTSLGEEALAQSALEAGAVGCLLKNVSAEELAVAIRTAYAHGDGWRR